MRTTRLRRQKGMGGAEARRVVKRRNRMWEERVMAGGQKGPGGLSELPSPVSTYRALCPSALSSYVPLPVPTVPGTRDAHIPCLISVSVCAAHIRANPSFVLLPYIFVCPWPLPIFFFFYARSPHLCRCSGGLFGRTSALLPSCDTPPFSVHLHSYFEALHVLNHVNEFNIRLSCGIHSLLIM